MAGLVPAIPVLRVVVKKVVDARHEGERSDAAVRTTMAGHDGGTVDARTNSQTERLETAVTSMKGPNIKKKPTCKNCEGKGLLKKGDKVVKCQRCGGTGKR